MSISTPTTQGVSDTLIAQLESAIGQTIPILPKAFSRVLAKALAGVFVLVYKYAGFIFLQMFIRTASFRPTEVNGRTLVPLIEWGKQIGAGEPVAATSAELLVDVTVENQTGSLDAGSQLVYPPTGVVYQTTASVALDAATVQVNVIASSDPDRNGGVGTIGNLDPGETLQFANPLPNVSREATVNSQVVTGADAEAEETYRSRVIRRGQARPQGGAYADYRTWGEEVAGILNIYPYTGSPGELDVYVEATVASSGSDDGIPTAAQLTAVGDAIDLDDSGLASRRPANAAVNTLAISRTAFDVTITGLDADDLAAAKSEIESAIDEYLRSREPYIVGLSVLPRRDRITESAVGGVADDTASAIGATMTTLELFLGATPTPAYTLGTGEKAKLGTVTYV